MKSRAERHAILLMAKQLFEEKPLIAVAAMTRGDVSTMTATRSAFQKNSIALKMIPNTLVKKAIEDSKRSFLRGLFVGQTVRTL